MKPSATSSVPQRARRSAVEWTPPKLVASTTSSQRVEERLGAPGALEREADERAREGHLARRDRVPPGWTTSTTSSRARSSSATRGRVGRRALEPQAERGQRAVGEPGLEAAGDRARAGVRQRAQRRGPLRVAHARPRRAARRSARRATWCPRASRSPRRGRAAAGRAGCRRCCRRRAARPRRARPRPRRRCRRGRGAGWTASRPTRARRRRSRRRSPACVGTSRTSTPSGSSCSRARPRIPG